MSRSLLIVIASGPSGPNIYVASGSEFVSVRRKSRLYLSFCMTVLADRLGVQFGTAGVIRIYVVANTRIGS